jgi:hypothetical protein
VERSGPWPFVTRRIYRLPDRSRRVWSSRHHRKGLVAPGSAAEIPFSRALLRGLWLPGSLNWWIGAIFAVGSLLFALASLATLLRAPTGASSIGTATINRIFFAGSIPFTVAAYLQLFQAANAAVPPGRASGQSRRTELLGWHPADIGWLSSALQFAGTLLFNVNTLDATLPSLDWLQQDLLIWGPDLFGSVLFLVSGYLAFIETCHAHWAFRPRSASWWVVFVNLLGCVAFMASALTAVVLPGLVDAEIVTLSVTFTLIGAVGFLLGSLLMLVESGNSEAGTVSTTGS